MATRRGPRRHFNDPADWNDQGEPTATVREVICRELARGLPGEMAAKFAGARYATYRDWLVDGRALLRRIHTEANFVPDEAQRDLMDFCLEVDEALASWVQRTNGVLEQMQYSRRRVTTKTVYELSKDAETGEETLTAIERHVTEVDEPIDATPIMWRLSRVAPQIYSATPRYEQETDEGESEQIDIAARIISMMDAIENALVIAPDEP